MNGSYGLGSVGGGSFGFYRPLEPVINYVARLNGNGQGYDTSEQLLILSGYMVKLKTLFITTTGVRMALIPSAGGGSGIYIHDNGRVYCRNDSNETIGTISIDGSAFSTSPLFPYDGFEHEITVNMTGEISASHLGYDEIGSRYRVDGAIYDLAISSGGTTINEIPLTNRPQGATQLPTVGNVSATMVGYTPDVWEVVEPVIEYVARLNGVDQYWQLSDSIVLLGGHRIEFDLFDVTNEGTRMGILSMPDVEDGLILHEGGQIRFMNGSTYIADSSINGEPYSQQPVYPYSDGSNKIESTLRFLGIDASFNVIGAIHNESSFRHYLNGGVYNIRHYDRNNTLLHEIPLTNKAQGATQLPTVGNISATMLGYTPDVWEVNNG